MPNPIHTITSFPVRYVETDAMGIVHHSNYIIWTEFARIDAFQKLGLPYQSLTQKGIHLALISLQFQYLLPSHFGDTIHVHTFIKSPPSARFSLDYQIFKNSHPAPICTASTSHACLNNHASPIKPPQELTSLIKSNLSIP